MKGSVIQGFFPHGVRLGNRVLQQKAAQIPAVPAPGGRGQPLQPAVLQKMEALFGTRFHDVRIHIGSEATALGAHAFTRGSDIYFAHGQYDPGSARGQHLLAHELTHVVQQRAGRARNPFGDGVAVLRDPVCEAEADRMAQQAARTVQRQQAPVAQRIVAAPGRAPLRVQLPARASRVLQRAAEEPSIGFEGLQAPTGYGAVSLSATLGGQNLGNAWSRQTTYSDGTEHAEDALVDYIEQLEMSAHYDNVTLKKDLVINNLTASPCSKRRGTCKKADIAGCAERLIELANRGFHITVNADHYYQPHGVDDAKNKSRQACDDMTAAGITVHIAHP